MSITNNKASHSLSSQFRLKLTTRSVILSAVSILAIAGFLFVKTTSHVIAACQAPATTYGTDTMTVTAPTATTYNIWVRMQAPIAASNSIMLQVDGGTCYNVGGNSSMPLNSWTWVNYQNGSASQTMQASLAAGSHSLELIGIEAGVSIDNILLLSDTSCVPTGTGSNCTPNNNPPTANISAPANGATLSGTTTISANASGSAAISNVQFKLDGTNLGSPVTASPYTFSWDTKSVANGSHTLTAVATDANNNSTTSSPISVTVNNTVSSGTNHYEYVFTDGYFDVYDMDNNFAHIDHVLMPATTAGVRGESASAATGMLYISYGGWGGGSNGSMLEYNLLTKSIVYTKNYSFGVDSMDISADGRTIYMPTGENDTGNTWEVIDALTGNVVGTMHGGAGPHNTMVGPSGHVYLGSRGNAGGSGTNYLYVANGTSPYSMLSPNSGPLNKDVRPFVVNSAETMAFTTASGFLGFQVSSIQSGKVLYTVPVPGFSGLGQYSTPSHGIDLSPDEKEAWVVDAANNYVHVFDISGLPSTAPTKIADVKLQGSLTGNETPCDPSWCGKIGWVNISHDGRFVFVGDTNGVINRATRQIVGTIPALDNSRQNIEVDWANGVPVLATAREGTGFNNTPPDTTPPTQPTGVTATAPTSSQVNLSWNASSDNVGVTEYKIYRNGSNTALATVSAPSTSYSDSSVSANTTYSYAVSALDAVPNESFRSAPPTVITTPSITDPTPPQVSLTSPNNGATVSGTVNISANATDNVGVTKVEFYVNGTILSTVNSSPYTTPWNTTAVANGSYTIEAKAYDAAGNIGISSVNTVTVNNTDTIPPPAPTGLTGTPISSTQVNLSWNAVTDDEAIAKYFVERNGAVIGTVTGTTYSDTTVSASTTYQYNIVAVDSIGNASSPSSTVNVTTPAGTVNNPPPAPTNLKAAATSSTQVNLNWQASSDPTGIKGYNIYRGGIKINPVLVTNTSYGDSTAKASTTYMYTATAVNGVNLESSSSSPVTVTTPAAINNGIIGNTKVGPNSDQFADGRKRVNGYAISQSTTLDKFNIYLTSTSASGQQLMKGIIYADSNGRPGSLVVTSNQLTFKHGESSGWYSLPLSHTVTLAPGKYWIGIYTGDSTHVAGYRYNYLNDSRAWNNNLYSNGSSSVPTNSFGSFNEDGEQMSLYASNN